MPDSQDDLRDEIWIVAEPDCGQLPDCTLEALGEGRSLISGGRALGALLLQQYDEARMRELSCRGVDLAGWLEGLSPQPSPEEAAGVLAAWARERAPRLVLFSATPFGQETAARVACRLGKALVSGAVQVLEEDGEIRCTVPVFGGKAHARMTHLGAPPWFVTLLPDAIGVEAPQAQRAPQSISFHPDFPPAQPRLRCLGVETLDPAALDLREAERIAAGGRGLRDAAGWRLLEELAAALQAAPAGSRAALDLGLMDRERLVGQTGRQVRTRLYLAAGISGSHYHLRAVQTETLVAINSDRNAAVFNDCQLGLVGDFFEIAPRFLEKLRIGAHETGASST